MAPPPIQSRTPGLREAETPREHGRDLVRRTPASRSPAMKV